MIASLPRPLRNRLINEGEWYFLSFLTYDWQHWALSSQWPPSGDWAIWLFMGGRGAGKTRAGAEWVNMRVQSGAKRIALVAPSYSDAREVMISGESGLQNIGLPSLRPKFESSRRRLIWPSGATGYIFSGQDPDGLRGPQFDTAWADEFCAWEYAQESLSNLRLGLRLGGNPRLVMTTTPKPVAALRALLDTPGIVITTGGTAQNRANLSPSFIKAMDETYGGSRLGRQELEGELIEDVEGALWTREMIDAARVQSAPEVNNIIVAIDPPITSGTKSDSCGLIVAGLSKDKNDREVCILFDGSVQGVSPAVWAQMAIDLYEGWGANYILAEVNQGGEMVQTILRNIDPHVPVRSVHASKSKSARAFPVAMLYEQGRVKHAGRFKALEDELCQMGTRAMTKSPDRADALVWAVTELLLGNRRNPTVRSL